MALKGSLRTKFQGAVKRAEEDRLQNGTVGKPDGGGVYTIEVDDQPGYWYFQRGEGAAKSIVKAINGGVPRLVNFPAKLDQNFDGNWIAYPDYVRAAEWYASSAGGHPGGIGTQPHTHEPGFGLEDPVSGRRFKPGGVYVYGDGSTLSVYIEPFKYFYNGTRKSWLGGAIDLTSYVPATANHHAWVMVGVNPADNTAVAAAGTSVAKTTQLTDADLDAVTFTGYLPRGGVILEIGQTAIDDEGDFMDARFFGGGLAVSDHGALSGLSDDDHPQYHNDARGDARYIQLSFFGAKGDLISASADNTPALLPVGTNGQVLTADSAQASGLKWADPSVEIVVDTLEDILQIAPDEGLLAFATTVSDTNLTRVDRFYVADGSDWKETPLKLNTRSSFDMGINPVTPLSGYGEDYLTDKVLHTVAIGINHDPRNGSLQVNETEDPDTLEVYLRDRWNTIIYDLTTADGDFRHTPLSEEIYVWSGNSVSTGLNGLPIVQQYQVSMGAYPHPVQVSGGTF